MGLADVPEITNYGLYSTICFKPGFLFTYKLVIFIFLYYLSLILLVYNYPCVIDKIENNVISRYLIKGIYIINVKNERYISQYKMYLKYQNV